MNDNYYDKCTNNNPVDDDTTSSVIEHNVDYIAFMSNSFFCCQSILQCCLVCPFVNALIGFILQTQNIDIYRRLSVLLAKLFDHHIHSSTEPICQNIDLFRKHCCYSLDETALIGQVYCLQQTLNSYLTFNKLLCPFAPEHAAIGPISTLSSKSSRNNTFDTNYDDNLDTNEVLFN